MNLKCETCVRRGGELRFDVIVNFGLGFVHF